MILQRFFRLLKRDVFIDQINIRVSFLKRINACKIRIRDILICHKTDGKTAAVPLMDAFRHPFLGFINLKHLFKG